MKWNKAVAVVLVVVVVVMVCMAGMVGEVRAVSDNVFSGVGYGNLSNEDSRYVYFYANADHVVWTGYKADPTNQFGFGAGFYTSLSMSFTVDGVERGQSGPWYMLAWTMHVGGGWDDDMTNICVRFIPSAGSHAYGWYLDGYRVYGWPGARVSWTGSVPAYDASVYGYGYPGGSEYGPGVWPTEGAPPDPVSVVISGSDVGLVGQSYTYDAEIGPGVGPYTVQFSRSSTAHPADDLVYGEQSGAGTTWHQVVMFPNVDDAYEVSVTVTDAADPATSDTDTMEVNAWAGKPVLYGQIVVGLSNMVEFGMFTTDPGEGALPWSGAIGTGSYVVTAPEWVVKGTGWYLLNVSLPAANPLKVYVTYTSPLNGLDWSYVFSFDTADMAEIGDWADSAGGGGDGADVVPTWLGALANKIKDALEKLLRLLFIPTGAQMATLLPSGSLGASLLDGTTWGAVATSWALHAHWDGHEVPLISVDLDGMRSNGFVVAVRYVMQALCTMALIYLVVVLI